MSLVIGLLLSLPTTVFAATRCTPPTTAPIFSHAAALRDRRYERITAPIEFARGEYQRRARGTAHFVAFYGVQAHPHDDTSGKHRHYQDSWPAGRALFEPRQVSKWTCS